MNQAGSRAVVDFSSFVKCHGDTYLGFACDIFCCCILAFCLKTVSQSKWVEQQSVHFPFAYLYQYIYPNFAPENSVGMDLLYEETRNLNSTRAGLFSLTVCH
jgi:hypothetical protein